MLNTILVHVDQSPHGPARMRYAAALARVHGAYLIGAAVSGVSRTVFTKKDGPGQDLRGGYARLLPDDARRALARFEAIAREHRIRHGARFVYDQAGEGMVRLARFADLVVLSQDDLLEAQPDPALHLPEYVILNCARPVLVVPRTGPDTYHHPKALVAWNGSKEASFALHAAIPLLRHAAGVTIAALAGKAGSDEGLRSQMHELQHFLGRHHVNPQVVVRAPRQDTAHELQALAAELGCGMLVMGCFGHSRFHELCRGGTSRTVLAESPVPFMMAH